MFPLRDSTASQSVPVVTITIIAVNVLIFISEILLGSRALEYIFYSFGLVPALLNESNSSIVSYYPFLTSIFLHGSWMHVLGNMWMLWLFGDNVEDYMGKGRFLLFYLLCGLAAGLAHYYINPQSNIPVVGASGAVAGVMGAYFLMFKKAKILTYIPPIFLINISAWLYLGFWVLYQFYCGASDIISQNSCGQIAFWSHVGGFTAGMILHKYFLREVSDELPPQS